MEQPTNPPTTGRDRLNGDAHITWTTLARAERLAHQGAGWSPDHVMRRALALLEREHLDATTQRGES